MLRKSFIQVSWLIAMMAISITGYAQDTDGFYVIPFPVPTDTVIEIEVCNGTPIGDVVFTVQITGNYMSTGDVWLTNTQKLIQITGGELIANGGTEIVFRASTSTLPTPTPGVKGPFYAISRGEIVYALFL